MTESRTNDCFFEVPFYSGIDFNTQQLVSDGYPEFVTGLVDTLNGDDHQVWSAPAVGLERSSGGGRLVFNPDDRQGDPLVPFWLLSWEGQELHDAVAGIAAADAEFELCGAELRLYEFGVGTVQLRANVSVAADRSLADQLRTLEHFDAPLAAALHPVIASALAEVAAALESQGWADHYTLPPMGERSRRAEYPVLQWWHRLMAVDGPVDWAELFRQVPALQFSSVTDFCDENGSACRLVPGHGSSVAVGPGIDRVPETIVRSLSLLNGYWAGSAKYDAAVFSGISELQAVGRTQGLLGVNQKAAEVVRLQEQVLLFRAMFDHQAHHLGPQEQQVWQAIARAWNLQPLVDGIRTNVSTLDSLFRQVAERVRSDQADRLNVVVTALTCASFLVVGADLFPTVVGDPLDLHPILRIMVFLVAPLVLIVGLYRQRDRLHLGVSRDRRK